ncbi:hypothetical protein Prudu_164S000800, partial [Prunus dulcis]
RPSLTFDVATATTLGTDLRRGYRWNRESTAVFSTNTSLGGAGIWPENHGFRRRFVRMQLELPVQISPPFLHQIDRVRHQEPDRIAKETFEGSKGDSAEFSAEVYGKFKKKLK